MMTTDRNTIDKKTGIFGDERWYSSMDKIVSLVRFRSATLSRCRLAAPEAMNDRNVTNRDFVARPHETSWVSTKLLSNLA